MLDHNRHGYTLRAPTWEHLMSRKQCNIFALSCLQLTNTFVVYGLMRAFNMDLVMKQPPQHSVTRVTRKLNNS